MARQEEEREAERARQHAGRRQLPQPTRPPESPGQSLMQREMEELRAREEELRNNRLSLEPQEPAPPPPPLAAAASKHRSPPTARLAPPAKSSGELLMEREMQEAREREAELQRGAASVAEHVTAEVHVAPAAVRPNVAERVTAEEHVAPFSSAAPSRGQSIMEREMSELREREAELAQARGGAEATRQCLVCDSESPGNVQFCVECGSKFK